MAGAQTHAKKFANQNELSSDAQEVREKVKDLGDSVGHMASRQYERAQDVATDAIRNRRCDSTQSACRYRNWHRRWFSIGSFLGRTRLNDPTR